MNQLKVFLLLIAGGSSGTLLRYLVYQTADRYLNNSFPWGTLTVNVVGSLLIGVLWSLMDKTNVPPATRLFLFIGFLGSFTTFSSFAFDSLNLVHQGAFKLAMLNILLNNVLGIGFCFAGYYTVKLIQYH
ncbi:MAG: fluoride efflux transporter CrcB [Bacteroidetes bacterium]|nr:fluoride efflux transporter CrcB [Bacteroidales bacterium]MBU1010004.1 fluoride efflux transporter CrcB [Bacteroidota bacterium]